MKRNWLVALALALGIAAPVQGQTAADSAAIRDAALDYIQGWYSGDADRMSRAVHPELAKRIVRQGEAGSTVQSMGAEQLVRMTARPGGRGGSTQRSDVRILDVFQNAAVVRVDATDWVDYLHLGRVDGRWRIINVLWELRPR